MSKREMTEQGPRPAGEDQAGGALSRRFLLRAGGAATLAGTLIGGGLAAADGGPGPGEDPLQVIQQLGASRESYWDASGKYFTQKNVDIKSLEQGIVRARIDNEWRDFAVRKIDSAFFKQNIDMRIRMLEVMAGSKQYTIYNDAHNAAVGTYGSNRGDSRFHVNVAFKGMGWVPLPDKIDARIKTLQDNYTASMMTKVQVLYAGYQDSAMWDMRLLGSLELYTSQSNETHTFLNQMVNPVATLCTLGDESYELRTVVRLMHYDDPNLSAWEKKVVTYINYAHDFFHGGPDKTKLTVHNIAVAYLVVEEFDNSPFGTTSTAGGKRRVPLG